MKTAISVPDKLFDAAERHARCAQKSRSQLYSEALSEYLGRHTPDEVTAAMDRALAGLSERDDAFVDLAARKVLGDSEW